MIIKIPSPAQKESRYEIDRAAKFGLSGTVGVACISLVTIWMIRGLQAEASLASRQPPFTTILFVAIGGLAVNLMVLFGVIGVFVDRKLEA